MGKKGIMQDKNSGEPIFSGHYIYGTVRFDDGSTKKFSEVELIEIMPGIFGVLYQNQSFMVMPMEGHGQIIRAYLHTGK